MQDHLERGIQLFNRRQWFESHQVWEEAWQTAEEPDKRFFGALIQIATALHLRFERSGGRSSRNLLYQAMLVLEDYRPEHRGVDVEELYEEVSTFAERLEEKKEKSAGFVDRWLAPRIKLCK